MSGMERGGLFLFFGMYLIHKDEFGNLVLAQSFLFKMVYFQMVLSGFTAVPALLYIMVSCPMFENMIGLLSGMGCIFRPQFSSFS